MTHTVYTAQSTSLWRLALYQLLRNKFAFGGFVVLISLLVVCFCGPWFSPYSLEMINVRNGNHPPSTAHWLGTDNLGRDILLRVMLGGRVSLLGGFMAMIVSVTIGSILGILAGYYRGWLDSVVMRLVDIMMSIPSLPLLLILGALLSDMEVPQARRIYVVMLLLGFLSWPSLARLVRGQILMLCEQPFMQAVEALGLRTRRKIGRHLLPNLLPLLVVVATLTIAVAILRESVLSYLGLGVIPPTPSWGNMITMANDLIALQNRPWIWIPPGVCIIFTVISIHAIGDGLRDVLDPQWKGHDTT